MDILKELYKREDLKYASFQANLTPTVDREKFIGVRVPELRKFAKEIRNTSEAKEFLNSLPHYYYDENMLHGLLLSEMKDYSECIKRVDEFLPYIDCWSVCDIMSPKIFQKHKNDLLVNIKEWCKSNYTYTIRFGLEMLMSHFLDNDYKKEYLDIPLSIHSNEYYVNMMIAWYYATALAKQYDDTIKVIENGLLDKWVHNKTIQKAKESYRITKEQKEYLSSLNK